MIATTGTENPDFFDRGIRAISSTGVVEAAGSSEQPVEYRQAQGSDAAHQESCSTCHVPQAGPDPCFVLQRVLVEKGSGPAGVPFWVEQDFLWAASDPGCWSSAIRCGRTRRARR